MPSRRQFDNARNQSSSARSSYLDLSKKINALTAPTRMIALKPRNNSENKEEKSEERSMMSSISFNLYTPKKTLCWISRSKSKESLILNNSNACSKYYSLLSMICVINTTADH